MIEKEVMRWPYAIVTVTAAGGAGMVHRFPAAFCFDTPDGFAFVTPGYRDPYGAGGNNFHRIVCTVNEEHGAFVFKGPEWSGRVDAYEATSRQLDQVGASLDTFEQDASRDGLNIDQERERLREILAGDLGSAT